MTDKISGPTNLINQPANITQTSENMLRPSLIAAGPMGPDGMAFASIPGR